MKREAVEAALRRGVGASPEKREALAAFNMTQEYRGECRHCHARVTAVLGEFPKHCPACGAGREPS